MFTVQWPAATSQLFVFTPCALFDIVQIDHSTHDLERKWICGTVILGTYILLHKCCSQHYTIDEWQFSVNIQQHHNNKTRHTVMYSLTFCVRVMLPERHQWKPTVQAAAVMLRTHPPPHRRPVTGQPATPTSHIRHAILRTPRHRPASRADPTERSHYVVISRDGCRLVTRVRIMLT